MKTQQHIKTAIIAAAILAGVAQSHGQNFVFNGSFEHGTPAFNLANPREALSLGTSPLADWTVAEIGSGVGGGQLWWWNGSHPSWAGTYASPASDGDLFLYFNGSFNNFTARGQVTTSVSLPAAGTYRLEYDMWSEPSPFGSRDSGFTVAVAGQVYTDLITPISSPGGNIALPASAAWQHFTHDFAVAGPGTYALSFTDASTYGDPTVSPTAGTTPSPFLDNVSITAVPEPGEYAAIAGLALVGFGVWRRTRRQLAPASMRPAIHTQAA